MPTFDHIHVHLHHSTHDARPIAERLRRLKARRTGQDDWSPEARAAADTNFEEGKHLRGEGGKFAAGGSHEHRMHEMSARQLDAEIEKAATRSSGTNRALINAGRGHEKYSETRAKHEAGGDPFATSHVKAWEEESALREHRAERQRLGEKYVRAQGRRRAQE